jgi:arsenate reductase
LRDAAPLGDDGPVADADLPLARRAFAEIVGTALLLVAVVGSGIAATRLSPDDTGLQLLENALATAGGLAAAIVAVSAVSGAHLNPVVTLVDRWLGHLDTRQALAYIGAQLVGATIGVILANLSFGLDAIDISDRARDGSDLFLAEVMATVGLLLVVVGVARSRRPAIAPFAVAAYIGGAYFFMSSTSFANPAVSVARMFTDTFTGIDPASVPQLVAAQLVGCALAIGVIRVLYGPRPPATTDLIVPREEVT